MATILIVDDDPGVLCVAESACEAAGHEAIATTDPTQAVSLATGHAVDAVVLDVNMPELSGFEVLEALRRHPATGSVPVLFLSALSESRYRIRGLREGANDYLAKPFEPEELVLRVEQMVAQRHRAGETPGTASEDLEKALRGGAVQGQIYLGRYQALETAGEGAMGVVLRGWDPRLKRPVALKTIRLAKFLSKKDRSRRLAELLDEATTLARFSHPNIVAVYDVESTADIAFVVMEYVDGISLFDYLKKRIRLSSGEAVGLGLGIARGLAAAHDVGVVHRDVKPGNILLGLDHSIKVTDFGLARLIASLAAEPHKICGTPGFVPPENLRGLGYSKTGDLFGLGAILFRCLTGVPAFGGSFHERFLKTLKEEPPAPRLLNSKIPKPLNELVLDLLVKDPEARPSSAREVEERLLGSIEREPEWTLSWDPQGPRPDSRGERPSAVLIDVREFSPLS